MVAIKTIRRVDLDGVLILVLVDDGMVEDKLADKMAEKCLNPCFGG